MRSKYTIRRWFSYQIILKTTIWFHVPSTLYNSIFTTYPYIACPCFNPQSTLFKDAYLYMIFACANCASFSPQPTIFNNVHITYFLYAWDVSTPQQTFYSGIFTTYLACLASTKWLSGQHICQHTWFCLATAIEDKPWIYHYKTLVRY